MPHVKMEKSAFNTNFLEVEQLWKKSNLQKALFRYVQLREFMVVTLRGYGRISYYISPKLLYEETGYVWNG